MMDFSRSQPQHQRILIATLIVTFAFTASLYSLITPPFEMSDELWHFPMVKTLADGNGLPIQDPLNPGPWKQEGSQPPLYYALAALVTAWIDTSDIDQVLRPNPHVDNGLITEDRNNNLIVHNQVREQWPWHGTILALHLARLLSVLFGTGAVYMTWAIGMEIFPDKPWLALAGAAATAFTPMFAFISGAVNNDSLAVFLSSLSLWTMLRLIRLGDTNNATLRWSLLLGASLGMAALTKTSTLGLFGLAGLTMAYTAWQQKRWQTLFLEGPLILLVAAAIAGWWYLRNLRLYGDLLGLSAFIGVLGQRARPASLIQLWGERHGFMQSYWGLFGGVNVPMPDWIYTVLNLMAVLSVLGVCFFVILKARREGFSLLLWMPALLSILWIAGVVLPLVLSWARITWSSQGRLVFSAISPISLWFMAGLVGWLPSRVGKVVSTLVITFMAVITLSAPFIWITPAYQLPELRAASSSSGIDFQPPGSSEPTIRLYDYDISTETATPGQSIRVTLGWESLAPIDKNWSIFIHLEDTAGIIVGQRDIFPGQGLMATSEVEPGYQWTDTYLIPISSSAYTPEEIVVKVGLYDYESCPACIRMMAGDGQDYVLLGTIALNPVAGSSIPNPVNINFGNELELIGYSLDSRQVQAGESFKLMLYWKGIHPIELNYTISVQVLGRNHQIIGQRDSWPVNGEAPTSGWTSGNVLEDTYEIVIDPEASSGTYDIQVVVYSTDAAGGINRLQRVTEDGRLIDDYLLLTRIQVR